MIKIYKWTVTCVPFERGPIRKMTMEVVATSRKNAELWVLDHAHKFFDQDIHYTWSEPTEGYKESIN